jgi:hypothetical protein
VHPSHFVTCAHFSKPGDEAAVWHGVTQVEPPETDAREGLEGMEASLSGSRQRVAVSSGLRFTDKDEHMYFWFPLLAGLSELTFDPRADIRFEPLLLSATRK